MRWTVKLALAALLTATAQQSVSQTVVDERPLFSVALGMGAGIHSAPSLVDFISSYGTTSSGERLDEFSSMVEFYIAPAVRVEPQWSVGVEYALLLKSHTVGNSSSSSGAEFSYLVHMPTAIVHYIIDEPAYNLRFGGGAGYHLATLTQTLRVFGAEEQFSASGVGVKLEAVGNTKFDDTFYGNIGVDMRWDFLGSLKNAAGVPAYNRATNAEATMRFFSLSLKFGVLFQL